MFPYRQYVSHCIDGHILFNRVNGVQRRLFNLDMFVLFFYMCQFYYTTNSGGSMLWSKKFCGYTKCFLGDYGNLYIFFLYLKKAF